MAKINSKEEIIRYYDTCEQNYRKWWDLDESLSMHAGYWDETTTTLREALARENQILAERAQISSADNVLDAGCGFGGSALYLATHYGCQVTGITLAQRQVEVAQSKAKERGLATKAHFRIEDYVNTTFSPDTFDVVWAIESVCHVSDKRDFIKEAWRLLRPGGRLILADGFNVKAKNSEKEEKLIAKAMSGWSVNSLDAIGFFEEELRDQGFEKITITDATPHVLKSSKKLYLYSFPATFYSKLGEYCGWSTKRQTQDFISYYYQYQIVKKGLSKYYMVYAEKPNI